MNLSWIYSLFSGDFRFTSSYTKPLCVLNYIFIKASDFCFPIQQVGIVAFDEEAYTLGDTPPTCYKQILAIATNDNKRQLIYYTNRMITKQGSNYGKALKTAFNFFSFSSSTLNGEERGKAEKERVVLKPCYT